MRSACENFTLLSSLSSVYIISRQSVSDGNQIFLLNILIKNTININSTVNGCYSGFRTKKKRDKLEFLGRDEKRNKLLGFYLWLLLLFARSQQAVQCSVTTIQYVKLDARCWVSLFSLQVLQSSRSHLLHISGVVVTQVFALLISYQDCDISEHPVNPWPSPLRKTHMR